MVEKRMDESVDVSNYSQSSTIEMYLLQNTVDITVEITTEINRKTCLKIKWKVGN